MRLTNNIRQEIVRNAMALRFDKLQKEINLEENVMAEKVYDHFVTKEMVDAITVLEKSGLSFFGKKAIAFIVYLDSYEIKMCMSGKSRVMPAGWHEFNMHTRNDGKLAKDVLEFHHRRKQLSADREKAERQLMVLLKSVYSTDSLAKVWPEGAKLYSSPPLPKAMAGLPAVQIAELNKMIGLEQAA